MFLGWHEMTRKQKSFVSNLFPVVPHKAVAEISKIGSL
jgi:hypothetical protein